ncbi:hypothetical protein M9H77_36913 [Catharanthus roseus]|uniref:Uncharacterized protein n=1 Tax=Catharanthus roseus TaxID=4058 RepID=A0ACB9ZTZ4_CATRO|nr:hypothetical protein M9H77_36913 [Catharanthus roseus]
MDSSLKSMEILKEVISKRKHFEVENHTAQSSADAPSDNTSSCQVYSADKIMNNSAVQSDLPPEVSEDLVLVLLVQASAEMVAIGKFALARRLRCLCDDEILVHGSPVQRTVFYFARALKERIDQELEKDPSRMKAKVRMPVDLEQTLISLKPSYMATQEELPFFLATGCTGVQSILDSVTKQNKIHLIDFGINNGSHWTMMMQALAVQSESPLELLKITAVGTSKKMMKDIGKRLSSFSESLKIRFSFKMVISDLKELEEDLFELEADEAVVIYMALWVCTSLTWYGQLEGLMGLIKNLKHYLILVREVEERIHHERMDGWRAIFARYNIVEPELSPSSLSQASLLLKRSPQWSSCSLEMDEKCLILSWNETRMMSLSAWKPLESLQLIMATALHFFSDISN